MTLPVPAPESWKVGQYRSAVRNPPSASLPRRRTPSRRPAPLFAASMLSLLSLAADAPPSDPAGTAFFEARIRPVLATRCFPCHSAQAKPIRAGLRLDLRSGLRDGGLSGPAVIPGNPDDSLLNRVLEGSSETGTMPPTGRLPDATLDDFRRWVRLGAPDPRAK